MTTQTVPLSAEEVVQARGWRENEDASWADVAERLGHDRNMWRHVKGAVESAAGAAEVEPQNKLQEMIAERRAKQQELARKVNGQISGDISDFQRLNRPLTEEELDDAEQAFHMRITLDEIAAAMDPPVHWLTVQAQLGEKRQAYTPGVKLMVMPDHIQSDEDIQREQARMLGQQVLAR